MKEWGDQEAEALGVCGSGLQEGLDEGVEKAEWGARRVPRVMVCGGGGGEGKRSGGRTGDPVGFI